MSIQINIETYLDDAAARAQQAALEAKNQKIAGAIKQNEKDSKVAFEKTMSAMRASYQVIGGISQILGGSMGAAFGAIYGVGYAAITMYSAIAAAQFFVPGMQVQSALMVMSLITAAASLAGVIAGQTDLSSKVGALNQVISGIGGYLNSMDFG